MRKINEKLIESLKNGELKSLLLYLRQNKDRFRMESRMGGKCFVYYKKCKILELGVRSANIDKKYFENNELQDDIKDPHKRINLLKTTPEKYFKITSEAIDKWLDKHPKNEFETQQLIATKNAQPDGNFLIIDVEYNFSQKEIEKENRVKKAGFDLLGIDTKSNQNHIVLFELKKGLKALTGNSGIATHISDYKNYLFGKHKDLFRRNLHKDIKSIITDKIELGFLPTDASKLIPTEIADENLSFIFIFKPNSSDEKGVYDETFTKETGDSEAPPATIFLSNGNYHL